MDKIILDGTKRLATGLFALLFFFPVDSHAQSIISWFCKLISKPNCEELLMKQGATRTGEMEFGTRVVIINPSDAMRMDIDCGQCRDPLPLSASEIAVRTPQGLAILSVSDRKIDRSYSLPRIEHLLAVEPGRGNWIVAVGGSNACPELALFDSHLGVLSRDGIPSQAENTCPLPRLGRFKGNKALQLKGGRSQNAIYIRSLDVSAEEPTILIPRASGDFSIWFDPQWFGNEVIYVEK